MSISIHVTHHKNRAAAEGVSAQFAATGGTIGRAPSSTLVLRDPENVISRTHASVEARGGAYLLRVLGKNSIEVNGRTYAQGEEAKLEVGDELAIGDYRLEVRLSESLDPPTQSLAYDEPPAAGGRPSLATDNLGLSVKPVGESLQAFGLDLGGGSAPVESRPPERTERAAQSDRLPVINEPVSLRPPPTSSARAVPSITESNKIPDDWDPFAEVFDRSVAAVNGERDKAGGTFPPQVSTPAGAAESARAEVSAPAAATGDENAQAAAQSIEALVTPAQASALPPGVQVGNDVRSVRTLLAGAGVPEVEARALKDPDVIKAVGELLRETVDGLHRALRARAAAKREMRVDQTMMESAGNNPIKFSPDAKEALRYLLAPRGGTGFLSPLEAIRQSFGDIQAHQLAMMTGVRAALQGVFQRFDPKELEKRLKGEGLLERALPAVRKAKMWDLMVELHGKTVKEAQDDFERLFGETFAKAYQEQMRKLRGTGKRVRQDDDQ